jgi:hypothetical protein
MLKVLSLIALGAIYRLVPHPVNAVPMGALALFAGASLPRRWAWIVPVAAMGISDLIIDSAIGRPLLDTSRWLVYGSFAATTLLGPLAKRPKLGPLLLPALSLSASTLFFLTSNFAWAWWAKDSIYPHSFSGIVACYAAALPFFDKTILADLIGTAVLFGLGSVLERARFLIFPPRPALQPVEVTLDR